MLYYVRPIDHSHAEGGQDDQGGQGNQTGRSVWGQVMFLELGCLQSATALY
jgi:hypothetical protein